MADTTGSYTGLGERGDAVSRREHNAVAAAKKVVAKGAAVGGTFPDILVDADGTVHVTGAVSGGGGTQIDDGDAVDTDTQGNLILGATAVPGVAHPVHVDASGDVQVDIASAPTLTVQATNLDIRDLSSATDSVAVTDGGGSITVDGTVAVSSVAGTVTVAATNLDIRDLSSATDSVAVTDGGGSLTVDGTVAVSSVGGTVTADTELPAAAALADNTANPVTPVVGACIEVFDGSTWDRLRGDSTGGAFVQGPIAHDGAVTGNPVLIGVEADDSIRAAVSADADLTRPWADRRGRSVITSQYPGDQIATATTLSNTTETAVTVNPASTAQVVVYQIAVTNGSATLVRIDFRDDASATVILSMYLAPDGGGFVMDFPDGLVMTADNPMTAQLSASVTDVRVNTIAKTVTV